MSYFWDEISSKFPKKMDIFLIVVIIDFKMEDQWKRRQINFSRPLYVHVSMGPSLPMVQ